MGPPLAVVAVARMVLALALRLTVMVLFCQVSQLPVAPKASPAETTEPVALENSVWLCGLRIFAG